MERKNHLRDYLKSNKIDLLGVINHSTHEVKLSGGKMTKVHGIKIKILIEAIPEFKTMLLYYGAEETDGMKYSIELFHTRMLHGLVVYMCDIFELLLENKPLLKDFKGITGVVSLMESIMTRITFDSDVKYLLELMLARKDPALLEYIFIPTDISRFYLGKKKIKTNKIIEGED